MPKYEHSETLEVSIPHRQATNMVLQGIGPDACLVSIPHRQATNEVIMLHRLPNDVFQSLIGRLQTRPLILQVSLLRCFNPSQVGYKLLQIWRNSNRTAVSIPHRQATNPLRHTRIYSLNRFQSLIGRLQTRLIENGRIIVCDVSIPHRQATNLLLPSLLSLLRDRFNPSQVGYKLNEIRKLYQLQKGFNPSQVGYKREGNR